MVPFFPFPLSLTKFHHCGRACTHVRRDSQASVWISSCSLRKLWQRFRNVGRSSETESRRPDDRLPKPREPQQLTAPRSSWSCWPRDFTESARFSSLSSTKASWPTTGRSKVRARVTGSFVSDAWPPTMTAGSVNGGSEKSLYKSAGLRFCSDSEGKCVFLNVFTPATVTEQRAGP